jgi:hypothetical protein
MNKRKFRSTKRKKRKGFSGVRRQEKTDHLGDGVTVLHCIPSTSSAVSDSSVRSSVADIQNMSEKKLLNSSFQEFESSGGVLTRKQAKDIGQKTFQRTNVEIATGFKVQPDAVLLNDCISDAAICSSCRLASSKLQFYQKNNEREGLCESLFLK